MNLSKNLFNFLAARGYICGQGKYTYVTSLGPDADFPENETDTENEKDREERQKKFLEEKKLKNYFYRAFENNYLDYFSGIVKENEDAEMEIDRLEKEEKEREKDGKGEKEEKGEKGREKVDEGKKEKKEKKNQEFTEKVGNNEKDFSKESTLKAEHNDIKTDNLGKENKVVIDKEIDDLKNEEKRNEDEKEEMNTMKKEVVKTDEISPIEFSRNYFQDLLGIKL